MFSFHKPKVYRSSTGCCICKAKSSSSRFTDSKKYEDDFLECFQLVAPRQGEICNACVLLVKRWKKLPAGSDRNWRHVVDARAGPGMKSMMKFKSKNKKLIENTTEKIEKIVKKKKRKLEREASPALSDQSDSNQNNDLDDGNLIYNKVNEYLSGSNSRGSSRVNSPVNSDCEDTNSGVAPSRRRKAQAFKRFESSTEIISDFVDLTFWKREVICCGTIYKGPNEELLIDPRFIKPCKARLALLDSNKNCQDEEKQLTDSSTKSTNSNSEINSDSSSDSGYDENSLENLTNNCNIFTNINLKNSN